MKVAKQASFCIPRAAYEALMNASATVYDIAAYLVLARFTDSTGVFSTASISAINRYTGANKLKHGPVERAIKRLKTIHVVQTTVEGEKDLGPILIDRETWCADHDEVLPDGPTERGTVLYVLPDFGESLDTRIWFGGNLVMGIRQFAQPLKALKNAGDEAARLMLLMYAANDMETWGGVRPVGTGAGPWKHYEPAGFPESIQGHARLIRAQDSGPLMSVDELIGSQETLFRALDALHAIGLTYEVVMVLNREAIKTKFANGQDYGAIPDDAEPYYEFDCRSQHGYKPEGEEGIGGVTARTAGDLGYPVTEREWGREGDENVVRTSGTFDGTYAAIVPSGHQAMIAGIFRLRFRVANPKNAGVKGAWARIQQGNREAFDFVQAVRAANGLTPLAAPWARQAPDPAAAAEASEPSEPEEPTAS